jgi:hypothetical protein
MHGTRLTASPTAKPAWQMARVKETGLESLALSPSSPRRRPYQAPTVGR